MGKKQKSIEAVIPEQLEPEPSYYAVIPANVRYDKKLTANAKLLYGEITALCNKKGYCWASNQYFAKLYKVSKSSISKWISQLNSQGYVSITLQYKKDSKEIEERHISIIVKVIKEEIRPPIVKNEHTPIVKICQDNTTEENNTKETKTGKSEPCQNSLKENLRSTEEEEYRIGKEMNSLLNRVIKTVKKIPGEMLSNSMTLDVRNRLCNFLYRFEIDIGRIEEVLNDYILDEIDSATDWDYVLNRLENLLDPNYEEGEDI